MSLVLRVRWDQFLKRLFGSLAPPARPAWQNPRCVASRQVGTKLEHTAKTPTDCRLVRTFCVSKLDDNQRDKNCKPEFVYYLISILLIRTSVSRSDTDWVGKNAEEERQCRQSGTHQEDYSGRRSPTCPMVGLVCRCAKMLCDQRRRHKQMSVPLGLSENTTDLTL